MVRELRNIQPQNGVIGLRFCFSPGHDVMIQAEEILPPPAPDPGHQQWLDPGFGEQVEGKRPVPGITLTFLKPKFGCRRGTQSG